MGSLKKELINYPRVRTTVARIRTKVDSDFEIPVQFQASDIGSLTRNNKSYLEIGFGNGEALLTNATDLPHWLFIGIEVLDSGVQRVVREASKSKLSNLKLVHADARDFLEGLGDGVLFDAIAVPFPDPWPKTRHHKRRLVDSNFCALLTRLLKPNGVLCISTDWADYAHKIKESIEAQRNIEVIATSDVAKLDFPPIVDSAFSLRAARSGRTIVHSLARRLDRCIGEP